MMILAAASGAEMFSGPALGPPHNGDRSDIHSWVSDSRNACLKAIKGCLKAVSCCWMTDAMHRTWRRLLTETRHHLLHHPLHYLKLSNFHTSPGHKYLHFTLLGWGNNKGLWFVCLWRCTMLWFEFFITIKCILDILYIKWRYEYLQSEVSII